MISDYKISVPIMNHICDTDLHREQYLELVKRMGAGRVFLCMPRFLSYSPERAVSLELLKTNVAFFKANGIGEVGTWFSAMGHGGKLDHESGEEKVDFPRLVGFGGDICDDTFCIGDPGYREIIGDWVRDMGSCGVDIIMLDDDLRLGCRPNGIGCTCEAHMAEFERRTGKVWSRDELYEAVFSGAPNKVRDEWFSLMRETFHGFAQILRGKLDTVAPEVRMGACACMTSFDSDCVDAAELARIFAGDTKPFLRGIGAAYWGNGGVKHTISDAVSYQRQERIWMKRAPDIEFFTEGDVYPRPRYRVPAWLLETFDTALRADGPSDGILKYVFDYVQTPLYEMGYIERHEKNKPLYSEIHSAFGGGKTRGVFVYEAEHKLKNGNLPTPAPTAVEISDSSLSASIRFLNRMCIPSAFEVNGDAVCVSGLSAEQMPLEYLKYGVMMDADAAEILTSRGVDCGILSSEAAPAAVSEAFCAENGIEAENIRTQTDGRFRRFTLCERAEVMSVFHADGETYPAVWFYENDDGHRFVGYAFAWGTVERRSQLLCSYRRQSQAIGALEKLQGGRKIAAVCEHHPELYMIVKDLPDGSRAVGLWNCFGDEVITPSVVLDKEFSDVRFIGGARGCINGDRVEFDTDIPAHAFAGFVVK